MIQIEDMVKFLIAEGFLKKQQLRNSTFASWGCFRSTTKWPALNALIKRGVRLKVISLQISNVIPS